MQTIRDLVVLFVEPRPHARAREVFSNLLVVAASKWRVGSMRLSVVAGYGLTKWMHSMYTLGRNDAGAIVPTEELERMSVSLHIQEASARSLTPQEYSDLLIKPDLWHLIAEEGWCANATHLLTVQTDSWLSMAPANVPSVWEFAQRYDYVGGPGDLSSWRGVSQGCPTRASDGVCSLDGGLSLRSIGGSMRGIDAFPHAFTVPNDLEDKYFMKSIAASGGETPRDMFARRFCTFAYTNPPEQPPLGYHKLYTYQQLPVLAKLVDAEPGLRAVLANTVVLHADARFSMPRDDVPNSLANLTLAALRQCGQLPSVVSAVPCFSNLAQLCSLGNELEDPVCSKTQRVRAVMLLEPLTGSVEVITLRPGPIGWAPVLDALARTPVDEDRLAGALQEQQLGRRRVKVLGVDDLAPSLCGALSLPLAPFAAAKNVSWSAE